MRPDWSAVQLLLFLTAVSTAGAQSEYHNTDAGRPVRVEDALATERHAFELQLAPVRVERVQGGTYRARAEPKLSYGILPRTHVEVRVPLTYRQGQNPRVGLAGLGVGGLINFNLETNRLPAFAVAADVLLPTGNITPTDRAAVTVKGLVTRSFIAGRVHLNATYSNFKGRAPVAQPTTCDPVTDPSCRPPPYIPDDPCFDVAAPPLRALQGATSTRSARACRAAPSAAAAAVVSAPEAEYWLLGIAGDRALALRSILLTADVFAERSGGPGRPVDWTGEVGARHQLTPQLTADIGVGHRFLGATRSWFVGVGTTYSFAIRALIPEAR